MLPIRWDGPNSLSSRYYTCGYCGASIASEKGWNGEYIGLKPKASIYICHGCFCPTFFDIDETQTPGPLFGNRVEDIPEQVRDLYDEARRTTATGSYTAAVLCCRKLLMHIAVSRGAKPGDTFISYVEYLANHNYVPPDAKDWVDHIRKKGNEANHEIAIMGKDDAVDLIRFSEMLLKLIYEFPASIKKKIKESTP
jgi:Domain of unknown function (DUF4145)